MEDNNFEQEKSVNDENISITNCEKPQIQYIRKKSNNSTFFMGVLGGILGGALILGIIMVPSVSKKLFNFENTNKGTDIIEKQPVSVSPVITNLVEYSNPVTAVAKVVGPSVVGVTVEYEYQSFFGTQKATQEGSGIIISTDGYILTNNHVVETLDGIADVKVKVYLPNSTDPFTATLIGQDAQTDIAILKIECTDLPAATLGNSSDLEVGEMVIAIGNPLGMEFAGSVTVGYVSALNRELTDGNGQTYELIQTDAAINQGNSGGALVNTNGQLIGINMAKIGATGVEGLGFAIPIDDVKTVIRDLIEYKKVIRPYIGIEGINVDEATAKRYNLENIGIYIKNVENFSAAEIAGLKVGDIIIEFDGKKVISMEELNECKNTHKVGDKVKI